MKKGRRENRTPKFAHIKKIVRNGKRVQVTRREGVWVPIQAPPDAGEAGTKKGGGWTRVIAEVA